MNDIRNKTTSMKWETMTMTTITTTIPRKRMTIPPFLQQQYSKGKIERKKKGIHLITNKLTIKQQHDNSLIN